MMLCGSSYQTWRVQSATCAVGAVVGTCAQGLGSSRDALIATCIGKSSQAKQLRGAGSSLISLTRHPLGAFW